MCKIDTIRLQFIKKRIKRMDFITCYRIFTKKIGNSTTEINDEYIVYSTKK